MSHSCCVSLSSDTANAPFNSMESEDFTRMYSEWQEHLDSLNVSFNYISALILHEKM